MNIIAFIVETEPFDVYGNMACDEVMCEMLPAPFILRFYRWKSNGITFGFSQRFKNVISTLDDKRKTYNITRRPTGGGIVIHEDDLTFSFIFLSESDFNPIKTYNMLHSAIYGVYKEKGVEVTPVNACNSLYDTNNPVMECFKKPVDMDLVVGEKKVLGGALRKFSDYMLYQASLQFENARYSSLHRDVIKTAFERLFNISFKTFNIDDKLMDKINEKAAKKYASDDWIKRI